MLSKTNRLNLRQERSRVEKEGRVSQSPLFTLVYTSGADSPSRFAVITSRKLAGKSSQRNYLKRLISETIRQNLKELPAGLEVIIIPKKNTLTAPPDQIREEIIRQIKSLL